MKKVVAKGEQRGSVVCLTDHAFGVFLARAFNPRLVANEGREEGNKSQGSSGLHACRSRRMMGGRVSYQQSHGVCLSVCVCVGGGGGGGAGGGGGGGGGGAVCVRPRVCVRVCVSVRMRDICPAVSPYVTHSVTVCITSSRNADRYTHTDPHTHAIPKASVT